MADKLLTARQVAERLQVSTTWVFMHSSGRRRPVLPSIKLGKSVRFDEVEVDRFLERCKRQMAAGLVLQ